MDIGKSKELIKNGIPVAFGIDGQGSSSTLNIWEQARLGALLLKLHYHDPTIFTLKGIIHMATKEGAKVLGIPNIGDIKEGYRADLITIFFSSPYLEPVGDPRAHIIIFNTK